MMGVLAVIPCLNEEDHLDRLLSQVLADRTFTKVILADGGSSDASVEIARQHAACDERLIVIDNPDRIQSAGVNRAVALHGAGMDWLVRIDAHCIYPDNYGALLLDAAKRNGADAVVVPMVTRGDSGWQRAIAAAQNSILGTGGSPHRHLTAGQWVDHGHHALMRIDVFREIGGYCETMPCNEDAELDARQTKRGLKIWLEPRGALTYFPRKTLSALAKQYLRYGAGRARTVSRHSIRLKPRQLAPVAIFLAVCLIPLAVAHPLAVMPAAIWAIACLLVGCVVGIRAGGGMALLSGFAAMVMHVSWGAGFIKEWLLGRKSDQPQYGLLEITPGDPS